MLQQPLAVCENRHFFKSGFGFDPGGTGVTVTLTVESTPTVCPECGAPARVLGGSYHIAEDTIELLQGPERTVSELERLRSILRGAQESGASAEEVGNTLRREFPGWGQALSKLLVPRTPADFFALLNLIVAVVGVLLVSKQEGQDADAKPDQIINNMTVVQEASQDPGQQPGVVPFTNPAYGEKVGRNDPCPCERGRESSIKFKKCHGKNAETRYYGP